MNKEKGFANRIQDLIQTTGQLWPGKEKTMKKIAKHLVPNFGTLAILGLFFLAQAVGAVPFGSPLGQGPSATLISYQGRLTDAAGVPLSGDYQMRFALYDVPTNGSPCWEETQTVTVSEGLFNVLLGSANSIDHSCLTGDVYLGIKVGDDSEMTPRELLTSVPYAVHAGIQDGAVTTTKLANDAVTSAKIQDGQVSSGDVGFNYAGASSKGGAASDLACSNCISSGEIQDGQVSSGDVGFNYAGASSKGGPASDVACSNCISSGEIQDGQVNTNDLADGAVTVAKINVNADLGMNGRKINNVTRISSAGDSDLWIDAGAGTNRTLTLHDKVNIEGGNLTVRGDVNVDPGDSADIYLAGSRIGDWYDGTLHIQSGGSVVKFDGGDNVEITGGNLTLSHRLFTSWLGSPGGSDLSLDAGYGTANKIRLGDHLDAENHNIENVNEIWLRNAHCGALVETNLQTEDELAAERVERFEQGDVLCWGDGRLEKCSIPDDALVQAVADANGKPIVIGAEVVKVLGPVQAGDLLVASSVPGYAIVNNDPAPGTVIAQALEDFDAEKGIIKAMIRKF